MYQSFGETSINNNNNHSPNNSQFKLDSNHNYYQQMDINHNHNNNNANTNYLYNNNRNDIDNSVSPGIVGEPQAKPININYKVRAGKDSNYKQWPGNNNFYCCGLIMLGANDFMGLITLLAILSPIGIYGYFILYKELHYSHYIITGFLFFNSIYSFFRTAFTDPGIILRKTQLSIAQLSENNETLNFANDYNNYMYSGDNNHNDNNNNNNNLNDTITAVYCPTCDIIRPPRAKHCRFCNNCVYEFDHHCSFVSQCIGLRNYKYFLWFIVSTFILSGYIFGANAYIFAECNINYTGDTSSGFSWCIIKGTPVAFALMVYALFILICLLGLNIYHFNLIRNGETTNENVRNTYKNKINHFNKGFFTNLSNICFKFKPRSQLNYLRNKIPIDYFHIMENANATLIANNNQISPNSNANNNNHERVINMQS